MEIMETKALTIVNRTNFCHRVKSSNKNRKDNVPAKVAVITAIFGDYEASCKSFAYQTIPTDFICFSNNELIDGNGWEVDNFPYHESFWIEQQQNGYKYLSGQQFSRASDPKKQQTIN